VRSFGFWDASSPGEPILEIQVHSTHQASNEFKRSVHPMLSRLVPILLLVALSACPGGSTPTPIPTLTGRLWIPLYSPNSIVAYPADKLSTPNIAPNITLATGANTGPENAAIDRGGNLWVSNLNSRTIVRYRPSQFSNATANPDLTIQLTDRPSTLAFDATGNLWVTLYNSNGVFSFKNVDTLNGTVTTAPDLKLPLVGAFSLAFDATGNLWVSSYSASTISKYTPAQLAVDGSSPALTLSSNAGSLNNPSALAFDKDGNLWVTNSGANSIVKFSALASITGSSSPTPTATIGGTGTGGTPLIKQPVGLAFDANGDLWTTESGFLKQFGSPQTLTGSVSPAPTLTVPVQGIDGGGPVFDPPPSGLPLRR
jgi:sugar lactone lactonase YvrE